MDVHKGGGGLNLAGENFLRCPRLLRRKQLDPGDESLPEMCRGKELSLSAFRENGKVWLRHNQGRWAACSLVSREVELHKL